LQRQQQQQQVLACGQLLPAAELFSQAAGSS